MNTKYANGYWNKIDFWTHKLNVATVTDDLNGVKHALNKLNYFVQRQDEVYGNNTIAGVDFSHSLNLLKNL